MATDSEDEASRPWIGVSVTDQRLPAAGWHVHFLPGVRTRVAEDIHAALAGTPGITWTYEPEAP